MKQTHRTVAVFLLLASLLATAPSRAAEGKKAVNINSADAAQLTLLPRVGQSLAQRIVDYRKENGPFKAPEDLMLVGGVGQRMFEMLKPYVAISGATTLDEKPHNSRKSGSKGKSGGKAKGAKAAGDSSGKASGKASGKSVSKSAGRSASRSAPRTTGSKSASRSAGKSSPKASPKKVAG
jgi:competence ComEA-like helix-hairpin-helix protein